MKIIDNAPTNGGAWTRSCTNSNDYVARGGSWNEPSNNIRSASRTSFPRTTRQNDLGFRIARTLPLTIVNSLSDTPYSVLIQEYENNRTVTTSTVQVQVRVTARRANVSMDLQLDPANNSLSVTPASPITVGPANQRERTASFTLGAKSPYTYSKTTMTIVVTDDSGNTAQARIQVETIPLPEMVEVPRGNFMMGAVSGDTDATADEDPRHRVDYSPSISCR